MPIPIADFWLPIVLATVLCFFAGAVLHMMVPLHKSDWRPMPDEDGVMAAMRKAGLTPGNYMFPAMDPKSMNDPAVQKKLAEGPCGVMTVRPNGPINMGPYLGKQFVFHLIISIFIAYLAGRTLGAGTEYLRVFQVTGTISILAYAAAAFPEAIWYHHPRNYLWAKVVDGVVWGLITAGSFAGFYPG